MDREERLQRQKDFLIQVAYWTVWGSALIGIFKFVGPVILPFIIAFVVAWVLCTPIDFVSDKLHLQRKLAAVIVVVLVYGLIAALLYLLGSRIVELIQGVFSDITLFLSNTIYPMINKLGQWGTNSAGELLAGVSEQVVDGVSGVASQIPQFFMNILVTVIATVFIELDFEKIMKFLVRQIPKRWSKAARDVHAYVVGTMGKCMLSYVLILGITFAELVVGFLLLDIEGAITIAFIIALLDILPVLGTGTILLPWMVIAFTSGNLKMGIGILALYLVITVVRNIIEPRLVGQQMGLPPVVMLPCMIVGLHFFGIIGLFVVPLAVAFINSLNERGIIHVFRLETENEAQEDREL